MFKENWERTNQRVHLSNALIQQMLNTYYQGKNDIQSFEVIEGGCANINVLVHLNCADKPVVLRVYIRDKDSVHKERKLSILLKDKVPLPEFYYTAEKFGYTFAIIEYLPGKTLRKILLSYKKIDISTIMNKVGEILGVIAGTTFSKSGFFNKNLEIEESAQFPSFESFSQEILKDERVKKALKKQKRDEILSLFKIYKNLLPSKEEKNLVHGDFDPANILVVEKNGELEISGILDWEFSFSGSTLCDVANMLRYAHKMPLDYQSSFLKGLTTAGYKLPRDWEITVNLLNIISLLDCLKRADEKERPNQWQDIKELLDCILYKLAKIEVVPYNSGWVSQFEDEARKIKNVLGENCLQVHHIGSTSIPGLSAKPIIDLIPVVLDISAVDACEDGMRAIGYEAKGEAGIPFRRFFKKNGFNIHIYPKESSETDRHIKFRDWLIHHPKYKEEYEKLKIGLSHSYPYDIFSYCTGKENFINKIDALAGYTGFRVVTALTDREWDAVKKFRDTYFFQLNKKEDPDKWTFEHEDHKHFILLKGKDIVGYAHIQFYAEERADINILSIDPKEKESVYGEYFINFIKKWLKLKGYKKINNSGFL